MILTDTGPLIALPYRRDDKHQICVDALEILPMLTTCPCFTEAMHVLGAVGGYRYQAGLFPRSQAPAWERPCKQSPVLPV